MKPAYQEGLSHISQRTARSLVQALDVYKGWLEIDTFDDYKRAWALIKE